LRSGDRSLLLCDRTARFSSHILKHARDRSGEESNGDRTPDSPNSINRKSRKSKSEKSVYSKKVAKVNEVI
jgi:hypothetical protein